jgi:Na+-driven multidrug efflux pump
LLTTLCVVLVWALLFLLQTALVAMFSATGVAAEIVRLFCTWLAAGFLFLGALFVANAAFNNLGYPILATVFNWGRATLGTVPFVAWGAARYGPKGVLIGQALGCVVFGTLAMATAFFVTHRLKRSRPGQGPAITVPAATGKTALAELALNAPDLGQQPGQTLTETNLS